MDTRPPPVYESMMIRLSVVLALASGCSVALQAKPQHRVAAGSSGCSTSHAWWIADAVGVAAGVAAVAAGIAMRNEHTDRPAALGAFGSVGAVLYRT